MGWYRFVFIAGLVIATMITIGVNLSPNATGYAAFVQNSIFIVWGMVGLEFAVHKSTKVSIFPFFIHIRNCGRCSPNSYCIRNLSKKIQSQILDLKNTTLLANITFLSICYKTYVYIL